jgi:GxxExxY protein
MPLAHEQLSYALIGKAMEVHRELGPGVDKVFYHELLSERLRAAGIEHLSKPRRSLMHRNLAVDSFEADLVFPDRLVAELKWLWAAFAPEHFVQLKSYLKFWRVRDGLLFDFGKESLVTKRYIFEDTPPPAVDLAAIHSEAASRGLPKELTGVLCAAVARIGNDHGLGYCDTTYRALLDAEFCAEGVPCTATPEAAVRAGGQVMGASRLPCLAVQNQCAVMVLSQRDDVRAADRAILQSWLRHLDFPWGLIAHFGKRTIQMCWVTKPRSSAT